MSIDFIKKAERPASLLRYYLNENTFVSCGCAPVTGSSSIMRISFIYSFHFSTTGLSLCTRAAYSIPFSHS